MTDRFANAKFSVNYAQIHGNRLEAAIANFIASQPYSEVIESDGHGVDTWKVKLLKPIPMEISCIAFDAAIHLRAALDQACFEVAATAVPGAGNFAHFPFGDTRANAMTRRKGKSKEIPPTIFDLIVDRCQPYLGGDDFLWALNNLCNTHKHERVIFACAGAGNVSGRWGPNKLIGDRFVPPAWDRAKNEMVVGVVPSGQKLNYNLNFVPFVALNEAEKIARLHAPIALREMTARVQNAIGVIESEARRLGLT